MLIDLSVPLNEKTPVYPGDSKTQIKTGSTFEKDGCQNHYVCISTHVGTHMDGPSHMLSGEKNIDEISLDRFSGRGVCIRVDNNQFDIEKIKQVHIQEGDIVLFHTGMSDKYYLPEYFNSYPDIPESVANYLVQKKIKIIGVDMCSPDHPPFPIHKILLKNNILIIENLANLKSLVGKEFKIYAFPLKVSLDGSPVRVVAEIKS